VVFKFVSVADIDSNLYFEKMINILFMSLETFKHNNKLSSKQNNQKIEIQIRILYCKKVKYFNLYKEESEYQQCIGNYSNLFRCGQEEDYNFIVM
jgi:hypothetical protein